VQKYEKYLPHAFPEYNANIFV